LPLQILEIVPTLLVADITITSANMNKVLLLYDQHLNFQKSCLIFKMID
jgi:hypothetical protein